MSSLDSKPARDLKRQIIEGPTPPFPLCGRNLVISRKRRTESGGFGYSYKCGNPQCELKPGIAQTSIIDSIRIALSRKTIQLALSAIGAVTLTGIVAFASGVIQFSAKVTNKESSPPKGTIPPAAQSSPSEKEKNTVIILGSGTVYLYLKASEENLFDNLRKRQENSIDVQILEGPTRTGAKMFGYAYDQIPVLVMASEKLPIPLLQRYSEPGKEMPKAVFEHIWCRAPRNSFSRREKR